MCEFSSRPTGALMKLPSFLQRAGWLKTSAVVVVCAVLGVVIVRNASELWNLGGRPTIQQSLGLPADAELIDPWDALLWSHLRPGRYRAVIQLVDQRLADAPDEPLSDRALYYYLQSLRDSGQRSRIEPFVGSYVKQHGIKDVQLVMGLLAYDAEPSR